MKKLYTFLILFFTICLGFIRDFIFKNINYRLGYLWKENDVYYTEDSESLLKHFTYFQLYYGKYIHTVFISFCYMFLCMLLFSIHFKKKNHTLIFLTYMSIITICSITYIIGYLFGNAEDFYSISRYIMGFVQSPVLIALLYFGYSISSKEESVSR